jgi:DNA-binding PadR family transcriptional regulator
MFNHFNKRFAFQFQGENAWGNEWTPPWLQSDGHPLHRFRMRMRHGFFGPGGPFGPRGPFGEGRRFFGRGDMKYALLELLQERPMHGYEMMKALEERSHGFYTPSAGSIYPTLQMLEDRGLVVVVDVEGKKVYSITEEGKAFLNEKKRPGEDFAPPWMRDIGKRWNNPEMQALRSESVEVMRLFAIAGRASFQDPEKLAQLRAIVERTHKDLSDLIHGPGTQQEQGTPQDAPKE